MECVHKSNLMLYIKLRDSVESSRLYSFSMIQQTGQVVVNNLKTGQRKLSRGQRIELLAFATFLIALMELRIDQVDGSFSTNSFSV